MSSGISAYYKNTKDAGPDPLLLRALSTYPVQKQLALDLGCGTGRDTRYLLEQGFMVTAVDIELEAAAYIKVLSHQEKVEFVGSSFADFEYKQYNLINTRYSLPFNPPDSFSYVMQKIIQSLRPHGLFVGQLFGIHDDWNTPTSNMTFVTLEQVKNVFAALEILVLDEKDKPTALADGASKHAHVFHIIARKI